MYELNRHFNLHSCRAKVCKGARKEFGKYIRSTRRWRQVGQSIAVMRHNLPSLLAGPFAGQAVVILSQFGCLIFNCFKCDIYFYFHQEKLESSFLLNKLWSLCFNFKSVQCDIHLFTKNDLKAHVVICQKHLSKLASVHLISPSKPFYLSCWVSPDVVFTTMWLQPCLGHMILKTEEKIILSWICVADFNGQVLPAIWSSFFCEAIKVWGQQLGKFTTGGNQFNKLPPLLLANTG